MNAATTSRLMPQARGFLPRRLYKFVWLAVVCHGLNATAAAPKPIREVSVLFFTRTGLSAWLPVGGEGVAPSYQVICHEGTTITVHIATVPAHLEHGDYLGPCRKQPVTVAAKP